MEFKLWVDTFPCALTAAQVDFMRQAYLAGQQAQREMDAMVCENYTEPDQKWWEQGLQDRIAIAIRRGEQG